MHFIINITLVLLGTPPENGIEFPERVSLFGEIGEEGKRRQRTLINTEGKEIQAYQLQII
jgi:hypothetical protein